MVCFHLNALCSVWMLLWVFTRKLWSLLSASNGVLSALFNAHIAMRTDANTAAIWWWCVRGATNIVSNHVSAARLTSTGKGDAGRHVRRVTKLCKQLL